jgi:hypothetical protein
VLKIPLPSSSIGGLALAMFTNTINPKANDEINLAFML